MEFNYIKNSIEKAFAETIDQLKVAYSENSKAIIFVQKGKDDLQGRCLMINFVTGSDFWLSANAVKITLWQNNDEMMHKDQVVELLLDLAKRNEFKDVIVQDDG